VIADTLMGSMKTYSTHVITVICCLLAMSLPTCADDVSEYTRATLRGIKAIGVLVEALNPDVEQFELSRAKIQTDVELKLRRATLNVLPREQAMRSPGNPQLYVSLQVQPVDGSLYVTSVSVELYQLVTLRRDPSIIAYASTWKASAKLGVVGRSRLSALRTEVADMVDEFLNAYLAENPVR
jgi:hypothetical protein